MTEFAADRRPAPAGARMAAWLLIIYFISHLIIMLNGSNTAIRTSEPIGQCLHAISYRWCG